MVTKKKANKIMFFTGLAICLTSAVIMLGNFFENNNPLIVLNMVGIGFIAASNYRLLK